MSFTARLSLALAVLLCGFGALVAAVGARVLANQQQETLQRLSQGLAQHIVDHWPSLSQPSEVAAPGRLDSVLDMLMVVNPAIEVYVLDAQGGIRAYLGDPAAVKQRRVDLAPVRAFLGGAPLPVMGTDPKTAGAAGIFSAARLTPHADQPQAGQPETGYLYVVLQGQASQQIAGRLGHEQLWRGGAQMLAVALLATLVLGLLTMTQLTRPLRGLAARMRRYRAAEGLPAPPVKGDEVAAMSAAFGQLTARIEAQIDEQARTQAAHHDVVVNVAHDLRTPLTALHGHLEALQRDLGEAPVEPSAARHLRVALAQSDKVRKLSQQLFELASLQASDQIAQVERFRLDELVSDAVQKFAFEPGAPSVALAGEPPGPLELEGDMHLVERALTNLIDNALRHAPGKVQVHLHRLAHSVHIVVEDQGPGLPVELRRRLDAGQSLREPPIRRPGGGFGGLGLAIAQRIAQLHGGSLSTRAAVDGGTAMCLALPLPA